MSEAISSRREKEEEGTHECTSGCESAAQPLAESTRGESRRCPEPTRKHRQGKGLVRWLKRGRRELAGPAKRDKEKVSAVLEA